jgi:ubiquinone/menaquinone biosynthesis C-methylase UbiE
MPTTRRKEQALEDGLVRTIFRPCAEFLVQHAKLQAGERLLDVGCGSGIIARVALELQPELDAAHGFDYEEAAVQVAQSAASTHPGKNRLDFWTGNAKSPEAYRAPWDVCISQHVVQHVPEMLTPMRQALTKRGRAVIATWPASSEECPAYSFVYLIAREGEKEIGMPMEALRRKVQEAGFRDVIGMTAELDTPPVAPTAFLRQYLEGKYQPPANIDEYLVRPEVKQLAAKKAAKIHESGTMQFRITMNIVIASA